MAIVGEPCNVDAHAKIPALFITILCPCCVYTCTVQLYTLTVTVQVSRLPIRASYPSRGHHTRTTHTHTTQSQMLNSGSLTKNWFAHHHQNWTSIERKLWSPYNPMVPKQQHQNVSKMSKGDAWNHKRLRNIKLSQVSVRESLCEFEDHWGAYAPKSGKKHILEIALNT